MKTEEGGDFLHLADALGIPHPNARRIVSSGRIEKKKTGGSHNEKGTVEIKERLRELIEANPLSTLKQLNMELRLQFPECNVTDRTISRWLDGMLYTVKKVKPVPAERNKPETIEERKTFATWFLEEGINADCIFVDETNFNLHTSRTRGRSLRGRDCVHIVGSQKFRKGKT